MFRSGQRCGRSIPLHPNGDHLFDGHYERVVQHETELGISLDRPAVRSTACTVRELSPRYRFRLRVASGSFVNRGGAGRPRPLTFSRKDVTERPGRVT
jgi:hypothetical protein